MVKPNQTEVLIELLIKKGIITRAEWNNFYTKCLLDMPENSHLKNKLEEKKI